MIDQKAVLLAICRLFSGSNLSDLRSSGVQIADEEQLFAQLQYHQLTPIAYHYREQLATTSGIRFSPTLVKELKNYSLMNISRIMAFEYYLQRLDELFRREKIDYRIFKGMATSKMVYPREDLRSFGDIDLLIRPEDLEAVENILRMEGFEHADDLYRVFPTEIIRKYSFAQHFIRREQSYIALDIHLNLSGRLHPFQFDQQDFWESVSAVTINDREYQTFDREHQAVYAMYHSFKHYFFKLTWFIDGFLLLDRQDLDRPKFYDLVKRYKLSLLLDYYARIIVELFGRLPSGISDFDGDLESRHRLVNSETVLRGFLPYSQSRVRLLLPMYYMETIPARLKFLMQQLFPPMETVRDFYVGDTAEKGFWKYLKLRCKAIADLCFNRSREEYSN